MLATSDRQSAALAAIGEDDPNADWELRPKEHAASLPPEAAALRRILEKPSVQKIITDYLIHDAEAVAAQKRYKQAGRIAIWARLVAIGVGALFLLPWLSTQKVGSTPYQAAIGIQYAALALAFLLWGLSDYRQLFGRWMRARSEAELKRGALFDFVIQAEEPSAPGELPALPLQLEYVRKYQINVQCRYYKRRGEQHASAAGRTKSRLNLCYVLSGFAMLPVILVVLTYFQIDVSPWEPLGKSFMAFGIVASGLFASVLAISQMNLDERNAARYAVAYDNLRYFREHELPAARNAAERGDKAVAVRFVDAANRLISAEHKEWLLLKENGQRPEKTAQFIMEPTRAVG